jgi:hypothetical protein
MHDLVPPFDATIARTLLGLETHPPGCQTHASAVDAGSLAAKIAKACNTEKSVLESLADFVCEGLDIHGHNRESYRRLWHGDDPHEFASIKPDLAALGNGVSTEGRFALYAGTLRLFGAPNAELTAMPQPDSESARLYNTLFALPNVSDDTRSRQSTFMLIDSYLDKFEENRGKGTIYAAAHSS